MFLSSSLSHSSELSFGQGKMVWAEISLGKAKTVRAESSLKFIENRFENFNNNQI
uniref:Uncharacterized protein n=1 Tax=Octopus bimaculoides TaxID=37653 RepID=A0A0L8G3I1_OCTBM